MFSRTIHYTVGDAEFTGLLKVGPIEEIQLRKYCCNYSIAHFHDSAGRIYGTDALEALQNCLYFLRKLILGLEEDGHTLWWEEPGDKCGILIVSLAA